MAGKEGTCAGYVTQKVLQVFEYLQAAKSLAMPVIGDVADYGDTLWRELNLPSAEGCFLHGTGKDFYEPKEKEKARGNNFPCLL